MGKREIAMADVVAVAPGISTYAWSAEQPAYSKVAPIRQPPTTLVRLAASASDGTWRINRTRSERCPGQNCAFAIRIHGGVVGAPGGQGSISSSGRITFPGKGNYFSGQLRGSSGGGSYTGRCPGSFSATRD
jgi:hypothetical protein